MAILERTDNLKFTGNGIWIGCLIMGFLEIMVFHIMGMAFPSLPNNATPLSGAILLIGSGLLIKCLSDKLFINQRISELENQITVLERQLGRHIQE